MTVCFIYHINHCFVFGFTWIPDIKSWRKVCHFPFSLQVVLRLAFTGCPSSTVISKDIWNSWTKFIPCIRLYQMLKKFKNGFPCRTLVSMEQAWGQFLENVIYWITISFALYKVKTKSKILIIKFMTGVIFQECIRLWGSS